MFISGFDVTHPVVQIETGVITRAMSRSALSRVDARKGIQQMKIKRTAVQLDLVLTPGVQHCLSAVKRVWTFTACVLVTLNVNDDGMM